MSSFGLIDPKIIASLKEQSVLHRIGQKNFNCSIFGYKACDIFKSNEMFRRHQTKSALRKIAYCYLVHLTIFWRCTFDVWSTMCSYFPQYTLIQAAKFTAKTLLMAKLLQNNSNLNDFEYSRHLKARKIEKRPKNFLKAKQRPEVEKPKFS